MSDLPDDFPEQGRLLGIDFGSRRLGFAISTPEQTIAGPLENYDRHGSEQDARRLGELIDEYHVAGLVVGLPMHTGGEEGELARKAREFGAWVAGASGLPVAFHDERFTTALAEEHLLSADLSRKKRKARRDKLAAQIMLQSFLDGRSRSMRDER